MNEIKVASTLPIYATIFGLIAVAMNLFLIPMPLGFICGLIAFIMGIISFVRHRKSNGLMLSLVSFLIFLLWTASIVIPIWVDPTLQISLK
ncbi:hypothetical protein GK047_17560 [Paenibacillus sp. SYP-B3998]|uniref:Uncharacterized protein n=1 Tax=Paenibacillus sp. SYP-B3998 TaxID=2678564 RepID=A0A6G4A0D3_9BACL|nr:hypothetical protein [Paenibacillus sp. SYP-B3998]NEW07810.1 hypothetical protein [Paenibacillus sp. SYP-B3998]